MVGSVPGQVVLHVKALRQAKVLVNDVEVSDQTPGTSRFRCAAELDITSFLRHGTNRIEVEVHNPGGPALLHLWLGGLPEIIGTDESWLAETWQTGKRIRPLVSAARADDTRMHEDSLLLTTPLESLLHKRIVIVTLFLIASCLFLFVQSRKRSMPLTWLPLGVMIFITVGWLWLFVFKMSRISTAVGFDAPGHLFYIDYIVGHGRLPTADEGWSTYHPPLFYLLSAAFVKGFGAIGATGGQTIALKLLPFLGGLGNIWLTYALARRLFVNRPAHRLIAIVVAGTLPMNIYMSAFVSNESPHACLSALCVLCTVRILSQPASSFRGLLLAGILFGLAILSKITALLVAGLAFGFLSWKLIAIEQRPFRRAALLMGSFLMGTLAISGWFFGKNLVETGRFLPTNWGHTGAKLWWQQPGFHSLAYYTSFGESLRHPYFSVFNSFWDGEYSTLWGDGQIGGIVSTHQQSSAWNFDFMSGGYLLAFPLTLLMILGFLHLLRAAGREQNASRQLVVLFLLTLIYYMYCAMLLYSAWLPFIATVKAFFGLCLLGPLALAAASGFTLVDGILKEKRLLAFRTVLHGWFWTTIAVLYLSYAG
jgi:hypothetical protein